MWPLKKPAKKPAKKTAKPKANKDRALTNPEQNFVFAVLAGEKDINAFSIAYKTAKMNEGTIRKEAHTVRHRLHIIEAIRAGHEKMANAAGVTAESLCLELDEARVIGKSERSASGMVAATMGKARLYGLDKVVLVVKDAEELTPWNKVTAGIDAA